ncbi:MAG: hypothetical protein EBZ48_01825 [Proteobacteria bacterium]|nr:hypothetical protein [Pseudomonadota bacterium]
MANNSSGVDALSSALGRATNGASAVKKGKDTIGSTDFMNLLVAQLKNQDPLNPMDNQQFAVQLAQFSQLEQLVSINDKVGKSGGGDFSSLASYLGHQVLTSSDIVNVVNNDGGSALFRLEEASNVQLRLLDSSGRLVESHDLGTMGAGQQNIQLAGLSSATGTYRVEVVATGASGGQSKPVVYTGGMVSGVVPGPEPKVIINGREVSTADIREVRLGYSNPQA